MARWAFSFLIIPALGRARALHDEALASDDRGISRVSALLSWLAEQEGPEAVEAAFEDGLHAVSVNRARKDKSPADGVVTGFGEISGRAAGAGAQDFTTLGVWTTAEASLMDPAVAVSVMHGVSREDDPVRFSELEAEMQRDTSGYALASTFAAHDVIDPRESRRWIIRMLDVHRRRLDAGIGKHRLSSWPTTL